MHIQYRHRRTKRRAQKGDGGFTLVELMIAVSIIGILLSLAIPTYLDYAARAKVTEAIQMAAANKVQITEFYISNGGLPTSKAQSGVGDVSTRYISSMDYEHEEGDDETNEKGRIVVTFSEHLAPDVTDTKLVVEAETQSGGLLSWSCRAADEDGIPERFLPANCRDNG